MNGTEITFFTKNRYSFDITKNIINLIELNDDNTQKATVAISETIENCTFSSNLINGKTVISVTIKAKNYEEKTIEYVLNSEELIVNYEDEENYIAYLDYEYVKLEYIESTGTQYIDSGILPDQDSRVIMDMVPTSIKTQFYFGARTELNGDGFAFLQNKTGGIDKFRSDFNTSRNYINAVIEGERYVIDKNKNVTIVYQQDDMEEIQECTADYNYINCNYPIYIFALNQSDIAEGRNGTMKLYSLKIYDNESLVRDFIPVKDNDEIICLYDKVENEYYYNQGTGEFIAGPEI